MPRVVQPSTILERRMVELAKNAIDVAARDLDVSAEEQLPDGPTGETKYLLACYRAIANITRRIDPNTVMRMVADMRRAERRG